MNVLIDLKVVCKEYVLCPLSSPQVITVSVEEERRMEHRLPKTQPKAFSYGTIVWYHVILGMWMLDVPSDISWLEFS